MQPHAAGLHLADTDKHRTEKSAEHGYAATNCAAAILSQRDATTSWGHRRKAGEHVGVTATEAGGKQHSKKQHAKSSNAKSTIAVHQLCKPTAISEFFSEAS
jgi:hypothetical protein